MPMLRARGALCVEVGWRYHCSETPGFAALIFFYSSHSLASKLSFYPCRSAKKAVQKLPSVLILWRQEMVHDEAVLI